MEKEKPGETWLRMFGKATKIVVKETKNHISYQNQRAYPGIYCDLFRHLSKGDISFQRIKGEKNLCTEIMLRVLS